MRSWSSEESIKIEFNSDPKTLILETAVSC